MIIISVVRDYEMYNRLVRNNANYPQGTQFINYDNRIENVPIPVRYNTFLEQYDYSNPDWFIFCHEDWELKENIIDKLNKINKNAIYGPIGMGILRIFTAPQFLGSIVHSNKDGTNKENLEGMPFNDTILCGTLDCMCMIVHSSLIKQYNLRFDATFPFDLYVEDFCINAREKYDIHTKILSVLCQHYSRRSGSDSFYKKLPAIRQKYRHSKHIYASTVHRTVIAGNLFRYRLMNMISLDAKSTKKPRLIVKILNIPFPLPVYLEKDDGRVRYKIFNITILEK